MNLSLKVGSFDFDRASVIVEWDSCKDRKGAEQLLKYKRAKQFRDFFAGKEPKQKAFNMPSNYRTAKMLKAGFHGLRHTLATNMDQTSASMAERAAIMRHSVQDNLRLRTYTHVRTLDLRRAIEALPDFAWPGEQGEQAEILAATGTDNTKPDAVSPQPKNLLRNLPSPDGKQWTKVDYSGQTKRIQVNSKAAKNAYSAVKTQELGKNGLVAQRQSSGLIIHWSKVRILPGPILIGCLITT
jgi:hypothetical protein